MNNFNAGHDPQIAKILCDTSIKEEPQDDFDDSEPITPYEATMNRLPTLEQKLETYESDIIIETIYTTAKDIQEQQAKGQSSSYFANIPSEPTTVSQSNASPLIIGAYNSLHGFQATAENAKRVTVEANPNSHIPLAVQQLGCRIGAEVNSRDPRLQRRPIDVPPTSFETIPLNIPLNIPKRIPVLEKKNAETQTTLNDGSLRLELSPIELKNLSNDKIEILMQFKKVFNINDDLSLDALKERLMHRSASQHYKNYRDRSSSSRYRDFDRSPEPKQKRVYYNP